MYLTAVYAVAQGDCEQSLAYLERSGLIAQRRSDRILRAYIYSMSGRWQDAAEEFPTTDLAVGNWAARRYWGNVLFRAGTAPDADPALLLEAEQLFENFVPDGSLALAHFWQAQNDPVAAFEEFRRALVNLDDPAALALVVEYEVLRRDYVAAMAARYPADAAWSRLALKYQLSNETYGEAGSEPLYALDYSSSDGRRLVGVTPDTDGLALGPLVRVTLYFLDAGALATQTRWVRNRMPDAGFAWGAPIAGVRPFGYGVQYGGKPPYPFQVERADGQQYLCLDHDVNNIRYSGLQSPALPFITPLVVMAGRYRTAGDGKATAGVRWSGPDEPILRHLVSGRATPVWRSFAAVIEAPAQADRVSGYLLQFQSTGRACFDDMLLFSLDLIT
jgi:tetratricopeptide (TPR) repeat protein